MSRCMWHPLVLSHGLSQDQTFGSRSDREIWVLCEGEEGGMHVSKQQDMPFHSWGYNTSYYTGSIWRCHLCSLCHLETMWQCCNMTCSVHGACAWFVWFHLIISCIFHLLHTFTFFTLACVTLTSTHAYNSYKSYLFFCLHTPYKQPAVFIHYLVRILRIECLSTPLHTATW